MNVSDQDLKHFKSLLLNDKFEEAKKILVQNKGDFKKELGVKIPSALKDLPRDDFATFLIPDDVTLLTVLLKTQDYCLAKYSKIPHCFIQKGPIIKRYTRAS